MVVGKKKQTDKNKEAGNLEFSDAKVQSKANMDIKSGKREIVASRLRLFVISQVPKMCRGRQSCITKINKR